MRASLLVLFVALAGCLGPTEDNTTTEADGPKVIASELDNDTLVDPSDNQTNDDNGTTLRLWDLPLPTAEIDRSRIIYAEGDHALAMRVKVNQDFQFNGVGGEGFFFVPWGRWEDSACTQISEPVAGPFTYGTEAGMFTPGEYLLVSYGGFGQYQITIGFENENVESQWLIVDNFTRIETTSVQGRTEGIDAQWSATLTMSTPDTAFVQAVYRSGDEVDEPEYYSKAGSATVDLAVNGDCSSERVERSPSALPTTPVTLTFAWHGGPLNGTLEYARDYDEGDHQLGLAAFTFPAVRIG